MQLNVECEEYRDHFWTLTNGKAQRQIVKCCACMCSFREGDVVVVLLNRKIHRVCLREALQQSYDAVPAKGHELHLSHDGSLEVYRQSILESWNASSEDERSEQVQGDSLPAL